MAAAIFARLRTMPGSASRAATFFAVVPRDRLGVEIVEDGAVAIALAKDGVPTEARLRAFEDEKLEERAVVVERHAPLRIVVADRQIIRRPCATVDVISLRSHRLPFRLLA